MQWLMQWLMRLPPKAEMQWLAKTCYCYCAPPVVERVKFNHCVPHLSQHASNPYEYSSSAHSLVPLFCY